METDERPEQMDEIGALVPAEIPEPLAPKGLTSEERQEIQERARALVNELEGASGSQELELVDSMTSLGIQAQRTAGKELDLLRSRVGDTVTHGGPGEDLTKELVELRLELKKINPSELGQQRFIKRIFGSMPPIKVLERIAIRYEPVSKQVSLIESRLRDGPCWPGITLSSECSTSRWRPSNH